MINKQTMNECMNKILISYIRDGCHILDYTPFDSKSREFLITYDGYTPIRTFVEIVVVDKEMHRTFLFQVHQDSDCHGYYDLTSIKTDHYLYKGEITEPVCETVYEETADIKKDLDKTNSCASVPDPVNHPNHYEMVGPFESFDIIVESLGIDGARQFCQGNIIKYQTRYKDKNGEEDLKKRHWYSRMDQMLAKCETIKDYYKLKESDF